MATFESVRAPVRDQLATVAGTIRKTIETHAGEFYGAIPLTPAYTYSLESPGKLLRPLLLLLSAGACGVDPDTAVPVASAVELIHTATLVHDDIMDASPMRRGRTSLHVEAGTDTAIVIGDLYIAEGVGLIAKTLPGAASFACRTVSTICAAQQLQEEMRWNPALERDTYDRIIAGKTGALFALSCALGGELADNDGDARALDAYGMVIGTAFQMVDDILDYVGTAEELGKEPGSDLRSGVITLPLIEALERNDESSREIEGLLRRGDPLGADEADRIVGMLRLAWAEERLRGLIRTFSERAESYLDRFPHSAYRDALVALPGVLLDRTR